MKRTFDNREGYMGKGLVTLRETKKASFPRGAGGRPDSWRKAHLSNSHFSAHRWDCVAGSGKLRT